MPAPPVKSKHDNNMPIGYEVKRQCEVVRNEKARLRMARYVRPVLHCVEPDLIQEQQLARERSNAYQAKYCAKNRTTLRLGESRRRMALYAKCYGPDAPAVYLKAQRQRKLAGTAQRSGASWDMRDVPYGFGYHPEENDGIVGMTPIPAKYMRAM
ncbi:hypothetical protein B0H14DRAFT_3456202 [Mycena olivaceomarginata]|nr:hypothetical protein B0H14DRAFT_3456202 [Mycena olivaceomarginata]